MLKKYRSNLWYACLQYILIDQDMTEARQGLYLMFVLVLSGILGIRCSVLGK